MSFNNPYSHVYPWETSSQDPEQLSSQVQGQFISLDPGSQGHGEIVTQGPEHFSSQIDKEQSYQFRGQLLSQNSERFPSQTPRQFMSQGQDRRLSQGSGHFSSRMQGQLVTQNPTHFSSQSHGQIVTQDKGQAFSQGPEHFSSYGASQPSYQYQGQLMSQDREQFPSQASQHYNSSQDQEQFLSQGSDRYSSQIQEQFISKVPVQDHGQIVTQARGQFFSQGPEHFSSQCVNKPSYQSRGQTSEQFSSQNQGQLLPQGVIQTSYRTPRQFKSHVAPQFFPMVPGQFPSQDPGQFSSQPQHQLLPQVSRPAAPFLSRCRGQPLHQFSGVSPQFSTQGSGLSVARNGNGSKPASLAENIRIPDKEVVNSVDCARLVKEKADFTRKEHFLDSFNEKLEQNQRVFLEGLTKTVQILKEKKAQQSESFLSKICKSIAKQSESNSSFNRKFESRLAETLDQADEDKTILEIEGVREISEGLIELRDSMKAHEPDIGEPKLTLFQQMSHFKAKLEVQLLRADQILETSAMTMELDMERTLSEINSTSILAMDHCHESQEKSANLESWTCPKALKEIDYEDPDRRAVESPSLIDVMDVSDNGTGGSPIRKRIGASMRHSASSSSPLNARREVNLFFSPFQTDGTESPFWSKRQNSRKTHRIENVSPYAKRQKLTDDDDLIYDAEEDLFDL